MDWALGVRQGRLGDRAVERGVLPVKWNASDWEGLWGGIAIGGRTEGYQGLEDGRGSVKVGYQWLGMLGVIWVGLRGIK